MEVIESKQDTIEKTNRNLNEIEIQLSSIPRRAVAQLVDFSILGIIFILITYQVKGVWIMMPGNHLWIIFDPICGVFLVAIFTYFIGLEGALGFTLGKLATGIRVVSEHSEKITMAQSVKRNLCRLIDGVAIYYIGIRIARKSQLHQRYGDRLAQTIVIQHKKLE